MPPRETLPTCTLQLALRAYWLRSLKTFFDFGSRIFFRLFSGILETTCKFGLTRLGRERTSQLLTLASQSHLQVREESKVLEDFRQRRFSHVCRSMSKKRPPGHLRGPSLKLPVPGSRSQVTTSLVKSMMMMMMVKMMTYIMMKCMSVTFVFFSEMSAGFCLVMMMMMMMMKGKDSRPFFRLNFQSTCSLLRPQVEKILLDCDAGKEPPVWPPPPASWGFDLIIVFLVKKKHSIAV